MVWSGDRKSLLASPSIPFYDKDSNYETSHIQILSFQDLTNLSPLAMRADPMIE